MPQALSDSQLIAVMEVRNLTGNAGVAGADLRLVLQNTLFPRPTAVTLREATPSQSRIQISPAESSAGGPIAQPAQPLAASVGSDAPSSKPAGAPAAAVAAAPGAAPAPAAAPRVWSGPLNASLVVLNMSFMHAADAAKALPFLYHGDTSQSSTRQACLTGTIGCGSHVQLLFQRAQCVTE